MNDKCDSCSTDLKPHASIYIGLGHKSQQHLCFSCYNEMMADYLDIDFETIDFDDIDLKDKDGVKHRFSFYTHIAGDKVGIMEAMKMQTPINSEIDGIVTAISAKVGDALQPGDKLLKVDVDE